VGCRDQGTATFPNLRCGAASYAYDGQQYIPASQDGVVAWFPPVSQAESEGTVGQVVHRPDTWRAPKPYRIGLRNQETFAGFLGKRGVTGPVHYLICEEAVPGLGAQVMLESGEILPLDIGCIRAMHVSGPERTERFGAHVPSIVAFTAIGRTELLEDLTIMLSGSDDGLFLDFRDRQVIETIVQEPENLLASHRLSFQGMARHFNPIAARTPVVQQRDLSRSSLAHTPKPPVHIATLLTRGVARLDPDGCSDLVIETGGWQCAMTRGCVPAREFLSVRDVGCGPERVILTLPYSGGAATGFTPEVEVRAQVESRARGIQTDVLRTRIGFRYTE
jgi:hypothetical protein